MFYATYKCAIDDCTFDEIAEFETEQERDNWVNQQEVFERESLEDLDLLGICLSDYFCTYYMGVRWYIIKRKEDR